MGNPFGDHKKRNVAVKSDTLAKKRSELNTRILSACDVPNQYIGSGW